ncbi:conserved protein of unknown function [Brochothrix thermosphacta]|uniref:DUF4430 domain-containing protein n=1 Tax=Brochothrix thermosphacta TaxID=2756 RepID=UPI00083FB754|nr:DUF4430 domain-containing protein [Brochothrix thermosphacta]ODJ62961.1 cell wall protein [Brochothrix thermosphacta]SPN72610.1 conserved protein of unknown function [Brochothrix thermosphacta]
MKKILALFLYLSIISLVIGCGNSATGAKNDNSSTDKNIDVTIILKEKHKEFERKEIKVKNKTDLQTAMNDNFKLELDNGLIISIAGKEQDNAKENTKDCYWIYDVTGTPAMVGANETKLKDGDKIVWDLSAS